LESSAVLVTMYYLGSDILYLVTLQLLHTTPDPNKINYLLTSTPGH